MKGHVRRMDMDTWVNILKNAGGGGAGMISFLGGNSVR